MRNFKTIKYQEIVNFLALFSFIDMLFIPRIMYPIAVPISLIFVLLYAVFCKCNRMGVLIFIVFTVSICFTLFSGAVNYKAELSDDIKRALQLCSFFLYYFLISKANINTDTYLKVIRVFFIFVFVLSILFIIDPSATINKISSIYPESIFIQEENLINLRFSYVFQDPNGAGYFYAMILACFIVIEKNNLYKYLIFIMAVFCVFVTQSRGSLLSVCVMFITIFLIKRKYLPKYYYVFFVVISLIVIYYIAQIDMVMNLYETLQSRGGNESSLGGGRFDKYIFMYENINIKPYGAGYNLLKDGEVFRPHSDFIRMNLSYGFIVMFVFFYTAHPRIKEQIFVFIPFLFGFMINSIIDEYRLICVFYILMGVIYQHVKCSNKIKSIEHASHSRCSIP